MADVLPKGHYRIRIYRGQFPTRKILLTQFSEVGHLFEGFPWRAHETRDGRNHEPEEDIVMHVNDFGHEVSEAEVVAWGPANGYLPSDMKEAHAFGIDPQTRDLQNGLSLIAVGSSPQCKEEKPIYAVLHSKDGKPTFCTHMFDSFKKLPNVRFLYTVT